MLNIRKEYIVFISSDNIKGLKGDVCRQYPASAVVDVVGKYKGVVEESLAVSCSHMYQVGGLLDLAERHSQECILVVTPTNQPVFLHCSGKVVAGVSIVLEEYTQEVEERLVKSNIDYTILENVNKIMRVI